MCCALLDFAGHLDCCKGELLEAMNAMEQGNVALFKILLRSIIDLVYKHMRDATEHLFDHDADTEVGKRMANSIQAWLEQVPKESFLADNSSSLSVHSTITETETHMTDTRAANSSFDSSCRYRQVSQTATPDLWMQQFKSDFETTFLEQLLREHLDNICCSHFAYSRQLAEIGCDSRTYKHLQQCVAGNKSLLQLNIITRVVSPNWLPKIFEWNCES